MPEEEGNAPKPLSPFKYFVAGGVAGICTVLSGHPLDTIKVRLQTMPLPTPGNPPLYTGTFDCAAKTVRKEGVLGLYKGMGAPLTGVTFISAISFLGFGLAKRLQQGNQEGPLENHQIFIAGAFSGIFTTVIMAPGDRIKTLLQVQEGGGPQKYAGPVDVAKQLYREGGIRSIYKGTVATLLRDVPASGLYFMSYEWLQKKLKVEGETKPTMLATIFAGGLAGVAFWLMGMPADVMKSRLQSAPPEKYPNGLRSVFADLVATEGPWALYKGFAPVMIRAFPANAACFIGFELAVRVMDFLAPEH